MKNKEPLNPQIGDKFFEKIFGGKPFLDALIEAIKNSRDKKANKISISCDDRYLKIVDNGIGMSSVHRNAFMSVDPEIQRNKGEHGKFGTGSKYLLYQMDRLSLRTVSKETPDTVHSFSLNRSDYQKVALKEIKLIPEEAVKNNISWPYSFPTGTELVYQLPAKVNRLIIKGDELAQSLTTRLPLWYGHIVTVDDKPLPNRKIVGERFSLKNQEQFVSMELFHPDKPSQSDDIYFGSCEVAEVNIQNLSRLAEHIGMQIAPVYFSKYCCGTIVAEFLEKHYNEKRDSFSHSLLNDPRFIKLITLLNHHATDVQRKLKLSQANVSGEGDEETIITELVATCNRIYKPKDGENKNITATLTEDDKTSKTKQTQDFNQGSAIKLKLSHNEVEVGEVVEIDVSINKQYTSLFQNPKISIDIRGVYKQISNNQDNPIKLRATEVGEVQIYAEIMGSTHKSMASFDVVETREPKFIRTKASVQIGQSYSIQVLNADKLKGSCLWVCNGCGNIESKGDKATFVSNEVGSAIITAFDSKNQSFRLDFSITVNPKEQESIWIRGESMGIRLIPLIDNNCVVKIEPTGEGGNRVIFYTHQKTLQQTKLLGKTATVIFLKMKLARAYAQSVILKNSYHATDVVQVVDELALEVYEELITK
jgi:hypothetical protein